MVLLRRTSESDVVFSWSRFREGLLPTQGGAGVSPALERS